MVEVREGTIGDFFSIMFETNPPHTHFDYRLEVQMLPLEIIYSKAVLDRIARFFVQSDSTTVQELEVVAREQLEELRSTTATKLAQELDKHKTVDLRLNISVCQG